MAKDILYLPGFKRPLWQVIVASLVFTLAFYSFGKILYNGFLKNQTLNGLLLGLTVFFYLAGIGLFFSLTRGICFDPSTKRFRSTWSLGPFKFGQWKAIENPEYISLFRQSVRGTGHIYEINLWYDGNRHWELFSSTMEGEAFALAFDLSEHLGIDIYDARVANQEIWLDKQHWRDQLNKSTTVSSPATRF